MQDLIGEQGGQLTDIRHVLEVIQLIQTQTRHDVTRQLDVMRGIATDVSDTRDVINSLSRRKLLNRKSKSSACDVIDERERIEQVAAITAAVASSGFRSMSLAPVIATSERAVASTSTSGVTSASERPSRFSSFRRKVSQRKSQPLAKSPAPV